MGQILFADEKYYKKIVLKTIVAGKNSGSTSVWFSSPVI